MLNSDNYINIQGWMIEGLHLYGCELTAYSIIFGFCQDGLPKIIDLAYFGNWLRRKSNSSDKEPTTPLSKRSIIKILLQLERKGLITVYRNKGKRNAYAINKTRMLQAVSYTTLLNNREAIKSKEKLGSTNLLSNLVNGTIEKYALKDEVKQKKEMSEQEIYDELEKIENEINGVITDKETKA